MMMPIKLGMIWEALDMDKDEILAKSRAENKNKDIAELEVICQASKISGRAGLLICCVIAILEAIFTGRPSMSTWAIFFGMLAVLMLVKFVKLRRRHELLVAILYCLLFLAFFTAYILRLAGVISL